MLPWHRAFPQTRASDRLNEEVAKAKKLGAEQGSTWIQIDTQIYYILRELLDLTELGHESLQEALRRRLGRR